MNQIIEIFSIPVDINHITASSLGTQLVEKIKIFAHKNNYKIITISHHCYMHNTRWGGHAIVVFELIENKPIVERKIIRF